MVTNLLAPAPIVFGLMFSPGSTLLNCGSTISGRQFVPKTWWVAGWKEVSLPGYDFKEVLEPAFAPDERTVAIGYRDGTAAWWDLKTGQRHETFDCESPGAINVAFSPDGRFFATVGMNGRVMLRDRGTRQTKSVSPGIRDALYDLAFSPDGSRLAGSGTGLRCPVQLWDVETGRDLVALPGKPGQYVHIGFSPDGSALFAASLEGTVLLWRAPSWEEIEASENGKESP
jgi:WD40 repeat protein